MATSLVRKSRDPEDSPLVEQVCILSSQEEEIVMADDPTKRGPQDRTRINLNEEHEVRYWSETLGLTPERLREVVNEVGNSTEKVRERVGRAA